MTTGRPPSDAFGCRHAAPAAVAAVVLAMAAALTLPGAAVRAADEGPAVFLGEKITPQKGVYLVLKDANIRAKPQTKAKKLGSVKKGTRIDVVGHAAGAWVAMREDGEDKGFVYDQILMPLIDGTLTKDLKGTVTVKDGPTCEYRIHFEGKSAVEGEEFEIADYDVVWKCKAGSGNVRFRTPMFLTEAPYQISPKPIYQVNIDILDLYGGFDEVFSTIMLYDRAKGRITFDAVSIDKYGRPPKTKSMDAADIGKALEAAVRIAVSGWNDAVWKDLMKNAPKGGG